MKHLWLFLVLVGCSMPYTSLGDNGTGRTRTDPKFDIILSFLPAERTDVIDEDKSLITEGDNNDPEQPVFSLKPYPMFTSKEANKWMIRKLRSKIQKVYTRVEKQINIFDSMLIRFKIYPEERLVILSHFENVLHQYESGRDFAKRGGLNVLLSEIDSPNEDVVAAILLVLGSAMQGNPDVQKAAYDLHLDQKLSKLFTFNSSVILSRTLYVMSSYLRQQPMAQKRFIETISFLPFLNMLKDHNVPLRLKVKIINLVNDLVVEQEEASESVLKSVNPQLFNNYQSVPLQEEIKRHSLCSIIPLFLYEDDFDTQEKVVIAMNTMLPFCRYNYSHDAIRSKVSELLNKYYPDVGLGELPADDTDTDYEKYLGMSIYRELTTLLKAIPKPATQETNEKSKDEL